MEHCVRMSLYWRTKLANEGRVSRQDERSSEPLNLAFMIAISASNLVFLISLWSAKFPSACAARDESEVAYSTSIPLKITQTSLSRKRQCISFTHILEMNSNNCYPKLAYVMYFSPVVMHLLLPAKVPSAVVLNAWKSENFYTCVQNVRSPWTTFLVCYAFGKSVQRLYLRESLLANDFSIRFGKEKGFFLHNTQHHDKSSVKEPKKCFCFKSTMPLFRVLPSEMPCNASTTAGKSDMTSECRLMISESGFALPCLVIFKLSEDKVINL